jgi:hypothetical protein
MPWPSDFEDILGSVDIAIFNIATTRTDMRTNRERLLGNFPTLVTFLTGETGVHSNDLMSGAFSLGSEEVKKLAPTSVTNGFGKVMVLYHAAYVQIFYRNQGVMVSVLLSNLEMEITALTFDLQMGLRCALRGFARPQAPFLASAQCALLAP